MSNSNCFGWDLLYKTIEKNIKTESDVIVATVHWFLVRNSFTCLGVGDDKTVSETDVGSELLPEGWNDNTDSYSLRYVHNEILCNLLAAVTEGTIVINFLNVKTKNVSNIALPCKETVNSLSGGIKKMIPNISELLDRFNKELLIPVFPGSTKEVTTQTSCAPSQIGVDVNYGRNPNATGHNSNPLAIDPLRNIGRGDLDPLGRGGGMLFNPPFGGNFGGINSFPGAGVPPPPGSRFDPFGPDGSGGRINANPNPSHFRPPPDFDDMYM